MTSKPTRGPTGRPSYGLSASFGGNPQDRGGSVVLPTIQALSAYWESETTAIETALGSMTAAEKFAVDRWVKYLKAKGLGRLFGKTNTQFFLMCQSAESKCLVNFFNPGVNNLTKVGAPTFAAFDGVSTGSVSNYYEGGIALNAIARDSASLGGYSCTFNAGASNGYDMGATTGSDGVRIMRRSTADLAAAAINSAAAALSTSVDWGTAEGFIAAWRNGSTQFKTGLHGQPRVTTSNASAAPSSSATVSYLFMKGGTTWSRQKWGAFFLGDGLSDTEMAYFAAATKVLVDGYRYGLPNVQPSGYGDAVVNIDLLVHSNNIGGAYEAKRQQPSLNIAILCDWLTESVEQLGGMGSCGLDWADITVSFSVASGLWYEMTRQTKIRIGGTANAATQQGTSTPSHDWNIQCRRMLDPVRQAGIGAGATAALPGLDIPVFFCSGLRSITQDKTAKTQVVTTNDGRVFNCKGIHEGAYDGDVIQKLGLPYTSGREAAGTGKENLNGYHASQRTKLRDNAGNLYIVNPYLNGVSGALLPDVIADPGLTDGVAYQSAQSMNFRQSVVNTTTNKDRRANFVGGPVLAQPDGYDAARYEKLGRGLLAMTTALHAQARDDIYTFDRAITDGSVGSTIDLNSRSFISSDLGSSGDRYLACGSDLAARSAVIADLMAWIRGQNYWIIASGDIRIESGLNANFATNFSLDATQHLDLVSWKPLYWPGLPYRRDPIYMLNGASGGPVLDSNDGIVADGGVPRISQNIVSSVMYPFDYHSAQWIAYNDGSGDAIWNQGGFNDSSQGNTNNRTPVPAEVCMAVESDCPRFTTSTCPALTKPMFAAYRMEPTISLSDQMMCALLAQSIIDGVSVQNTVANKHSMVRAAILANPDSVAALLTQTT